MELIRARVEVNGDLNRETVGNNLRIKWATMSTSDIGVADSPGLILVF